MQQRRWAKRPFPANLSLVLGLLTLLLGAGLLGGGLLGGPALAKGPRPGDPGIPDKALQKAIDEAIAKGADYLRSVQKMNGSIGGVFHGSNKHYGIGTTALSGLALLAAGEKKGDKAVDEAMKYCRKEDARHGGAGTRSTYDTGTLLMFATAYYHPEEKKKPGKRPHTMTKKERDNPCKLPEDISKWIRDMVMFLIDSQEGAGGWSYPQPREDMSNTQYALLGLRAARDCGGKVPGRVFKRVIDRVLALQEKDGPKVMRTLGGEKKGDTIYKISSGDRARGWGYLESHPLATGSMTTAGIACLAICNDALTVPKRLKRIYTPKLERQVRRAVQDGFAWLDINFTVTRNPPSNAPAWHYYYLYGLERAAVFAGRVLVGEHDWYLEGARYLVGQQKGDGRWATGSLGAKEYKASDILDTAWAILFLKKATKPMKPIPGPVITDSSPPGK